MSGDLGVKLRDAKGVSRTQSKEMKAENKSNKYFIVNRIIDMLDNKKTCAHRKKGLEKLCPR